MTLYSHLVTLAPLVSPTPQAPPGVTEKVNMILGYTMWAGGIVAVLSLLIAGIVIMLNSMGRAGDGAERVVRALGFVFIGAIVVGGAGAIGSALVPGV
ncbi:hypothetical protein [Actinomyces faecalis]|uniref:hypothetical protein n=1 Tax=Actinomyces faecalis TaxID=2722820 RepID=UPI001551E9DE|nr:hypothetical protein [Actinomyces faecalis]